jgi:hypothetical protein
MALDELFAVAESKVSTRRFWKWHAWQVGVACVPAIVAAVYLSSMRKEMEDEAAKKIKARVAKEESQARTSGERKDI